MLVGLLARLHFKMMVMDSLDERLKEGIKMNEVTQQLIDLLSVKFLHQGPQTYLYRGECEDIGLKNLFGGQILGQSLNAAMQAAPEGYLPHSMHAYFLLPGHVNSYVDYKVEILRQGRSFASMRVDAIQDGNIILTQTTSFHVPEEGFEHQDTMPSVPEPEGLMSQVEIARSYAEMIPESLREKLTNEKPLDTRPVNPINVFKPEKTKPHSNIWFKPINDWSNQDLAMHYSLLAYSTDFSLLGAALKPHGVSYHSKGMQMASLDHVIWFHKKPRVDDWMLYSMKSPVAAHARGLSFGHIYHKDGELMISVAQEGLIRQRNK